MNNAPETDIHGHDEPGESSSDATEATPSLLRRLFLGTSWKRTAARALALSVVCVLLFSFVLIPVRIRGASMEPTYADGGFVFINAFAFGDEGPERGDVVAIRLAGRSVMFLKRVVGLPGETVAFRDGVLLVDGEPLSEPYLRLRGDWTASPVTVGAREYFVVGDNRSTPKSSHRHGRVAIERIVGGPLF